MGSHEHKAGRVTPNIIAFAYSLFWNAARGSTLGISIARNSISSQCCSLFHGLKSMAFSNSLRQNRKRSLNKSLRIKLHFWTFWNTLAINNFIWLWGGIILWIILCTGSNPLLKELKNRQTGQGKTYNPSPSPPARFTTKNIFMQYYIYFVVLKLYLDLSDYIQSIIFTHK